MTRGAGFTRGARPGRVGWRMPGVDARRSTDTGGFPARQGQAAAEFFGVAAKLGVAIEILVAWWWPATFWDG